MVEAAGVNLQGDSSLIDMVMHNCFTIAGRKPLVLVLNLVKSFCDVVGISVPFFLRNCQWSIMGTALYFLTKVVVLTLSWW
ncbi:hypothetical protein CEXT_390561 [Caerostris extrusa]|uniref:Uncharacterized protein n=1 Tax=Caerostris extrusa TaxID=172846 RepID=A0AAV4YEA9_CAEEX|nr:hypothetical protein CEXT_390561 [Caerostris extrusa]